VMDWSTDGQLSPNSVTKEGCSSLPESVPP
jgi:hypothetical protein